MKFDQKLQQPAILTEYAKQDRYIPRDIYNKIKKKNKCKVCGRNLNTRKGERLVIHHIIPISKGGTNKENNLKAMCKQCHERLHKNVTT